MPSCPHIVLTSDLFESAQVVDLAHETTDNFKLTGSSAVGQAEEAEEEEEEEEDLWERRERPTGGMYSALFNLLIAQVGIVYVMFFL